MSVWNDIRKRGNGKQLRKEDEEQKKIEAEVTSFAEELASFADVYLKKAKDAFMNNDRYTCAIFYILYAIALNKDKLDIFIKEFLEDVVFIPEGKVSRELSLDDNQKKALVDSIFDRSYYGFGHSIASFDFSPVENANLPFEAGSQCITFFDFIGICKQVDRWPDIRAIY